MRHSVLLAFGKRYTAKTLALVIALCLGASFAHGNEAKDLFDKVTQKYHKMSDYSGQATNRNTQVKRCKEIHACIRKGPLWISPWYERCDSLTRSHEGAPESLEVLNFCALLASELNDPRLAHSIFEKIDRRWDPTVWSKNFFVIYECWAKKTSGPSAGITPWLKDKTTVSNGVVRDADIFRTKSFRCGFNRKMRGKTRSRKKGAIAAKACVYGVSATIKTSQGSIGEKVSGEMGFLLEGCPSA